MTAGKSYELERKLRQMEMNAKNRFGGTTDSELSELEDVVAMTAARVQNTESEVGGSFVLLGDVLLVCGVIAPPEKNLSWGPKYQGPCF